MNPFRKSCAVAIASAIAALPMLANASCVTHADLMALQNAALQQRLMVSAFQCHDLQLYNAFVLNHRPQLQSYDAALLAFFKRDDPKGGDAAYNAYKTHLANIAALQDAHTNTFCDEVAGLYVQTGGTGSLDPVLDSLPVTDTAYASCEAPDTNEPVIARNPVIETPPPPPPVTPPPIVEARVTPPPPVTTVTAPVTDTSTVQVAEQPVQQTKRLTAPGRAVKWLGGWLRKATTLVGIGDSDSNTSAQTNSDSGSTAAPPASAETTSSQSMAYQPSAYPQPSSNSAMASRDSAPAWDPDQPLIADDQDQADTSRHGKHRHHRKRTEDDPLYGDDDSSSDDSNDDYGR